MLRAMDRLPIDSHIPSILNALRDHGSAVVAAQPGAGKSTRLPPALARSGLLHSAHSAVVVLQPRRVAARALAMRIAEENGWQVGNEVGYHVRMDKRLGPSTALRILTEGILIRQLVEDPSLEGVGAVLLDEFHERSLFSDLALAMLREAKAALRPDLRIGVMSATLDSGPVAAFLDNAPVFDLPGRCFPIHIEYLSSPLPHDRDALPLQIYRSVADELQANQGDILVFLPGMGLIEQLCSQMQALAQRYGARIYPLHGSLPADRQIEAIVPSGNRKIILATNIAETSLTIEGVGTVIDSGLHRQNQYDLQRGIDKLVLCRISQASATQRAGRAGRTGPGRCVRLWTASQQRTLVAFDQPEIARVDMAATVLQLHAWGQSDARRFAWFQPPPEGSLEAAGKLLEMLGAVERGGLTPLGRGMLQLPLHPRLARLMLEAQEKGLPRQGAALAALLSEKDILLDAPWDHAEVKGDSDLLYRLQLMENPSLCDRIDRRAVRTVKQVQQHLLGALPAAGKSSRPSPDGQVPSSRLLQLPLLAYPDRVCKRRENDPMRGLMVGGGGVHLAESSIVRDGDFFLALDAQQQIRAGKRQSQVRISSRIEPQWLQELFPASITQRDQTSWDEDRRQVVARRIVYYLDLPLRSSELPQVDQHQARRILAEQLRDQALDIFRSDPSAKQMICRVALLRRFMPDHAWPSWDQEQLADLLLSQVKNPRSLEQVAGQNLTLLLSQTLQYPLDRLLQTETPEFMEVPSGSRIKLDYSAAERPVLAARLQELFGWADVPRIAGGRVRVVLHLLGPNYRVAQITDDLAGFWANTYFQVRKDLKFRYPRHAWPDDPLHAAAQAKGCRRGG